MGDVLASHLWWDHHSSSHLVELLREPSGRCMLKEPMERKPGAFLHRVKPCPPQSAHFKTELPAPFSSPLNYLMENTKANCPPQVNRAFSVMVLKASLVCTECRGLVTCKQRAFFKVASLTRCVELLLQALIILSCWSVLLALEGLQKSYLMTVNGWISPHYKPFQSTTMMPYCTSFFFTILTRENRRIEWQRDSSQQHEWRPLDAGQLHLRDGAHSIGC